VKNDSEFDSEAERDALLGEKKKSLGQGPIKKQVKFKTSAKTKDEQPKLTPELVQRGDFMVKAEKRETRKSSRINEKKVDDDGNEIVEEKKVAPKKDPER